MINASLSRKKSSFNISCQKIFAASVSFHPYPADFSVLCILRKLLSRFHGNDFYLWFFIMYSKHKYRLSILRTIRSSLTKIQPFTGSIVSLGNQTISRTQHSVLLFFYYLRNSNPDQDIPFYGEYRPGLAADYLRENYPEIICATCLG